MQTRDKEIRKSAPHQAVIKLEAKIMEKSNAGHLIPPANKKITKLFTILGKDYDDCLQKTEDFINKIGVNNENE